MLINIKNNFVKFFLNSCIFFSLLLFIFPINAHERKDDWKDVLKEASGQTIYFHAWGGAKNINSYIKWASDEVKKKYDITVKHVKVSDTANVVAKILSEKNVKKNNNGTVDLVWINGENFSFMKTNDLLLNEKWIFNSPNSKFLDFANNPSLLNDFGIPTDGMEMPWGVSQLNFYYDTKYIKSPPKSALELKNYIIRNKGRFTFPQPPDFVGTSFLKQILIELISDRNFLKSNYIANKHERELDPLWQWLEEVTPYLWRNGKNYPSNYLAMTELVAEREIDFGIAFNIAHASNSISEGKLSNSVRSYIHDKGTLANVHFLAIPYNSSNKAASRAFVDFLISPKAQIKKQNKDFWGDPSVISVNKLSQNWRNKFSTLPRGVATLTNQDLKMKLEEPHPSWVKIIEDKWIKKCTGSSDAIAACANAKVEQAQADAEAAKGDVEACVADGQACIEKATSDAKDTLGLLGCDDKPEDSDLMAKTSAELEADVAKFKADAEATGAELQACADDFETCGEKMKAKMTADAKMLQAKAALMAKQVQEGTTASSEHFQECVGDVDAVKECISADLEAAKAKSDASWAKLQSCTSSIDSMQSCFSEMGSDVTDTFSLGTADAGEQLESAFADAQAKADAAGAEFKSCVGDVVACGAKMQAKMQSDAEALQVKAELMTKQMQEDATANSVHFQHCIGDADAIKECVTASVEKAQADAKAAGDKMQSCAMDLPSCFEQMGNDVEDTFSLGAEDMVAKRKEELESTVAKFKADAEAAGAELQVCAGDFAACGEKMKTKMEADFELAKAKAALMQKEVEEGATELSENFSECTSDVPECTTKAVEDAKADAEKNGNKLKECTASVSAMKSCFEELGDGITIPSSSLGCEAEQAAFDAAKSEAQAAAEKVKSSCDPQSEAQDCLASLVDAAKADAAAASAKVALMAEQAKDTTTGVTDDMVAKSKEMATQVQAKFTKCTADPSWETCKPEAPPQAALLGGSITDDIQECFKDIPECWNKLVAKVKGDAEEAQEKAEEAEQNAEEAAEQAKDDVSSAAKETAAKVQDEADTLKAEAEKLAKEAEECAADPQACFAKLQGRLQ